MRGDEILFQTLSCQRLASWSMYDEVTNTWLDVIRDGVQNARHCLALAVVSFSATPSAPVEVFVKDGASIIFKCTTLGTLVLPLFVPIVGSPGNALTLTVGPAGTDITAVAAMHGYTVPA